MIYYQTTLSYTPKCTKEKGGNTAQTRDPWTT